ncbi:hypothetical protein GH714_001377 [Hevea brasiliensis]|uniref:PUM-HD domain-containing protein n=1 Tax=Hevea brasiliensis TaxID=3981 RepID=A0A6A6M6D6_HEVBR|nr:hypothetical protein GH714_001377 [Hevea brasiliensis]
MEKEKEKSVAKPNNSETPKSPNSVFSMDSSIESLTFSVGNLSLKNGKIHSICKGTSSMDNGSSLAFSGGNTSKKTQEVGADIQETGWLENSKPVPTPLYPQRIWGVENARRPLFSDLQLSVPAFYQSNNWVVLATPRLKKAGRTSALSVKILQRVGRIKKALMELCLLGQNALLYESAISLCLHLATHENGCISLNNFIDKIQGSHRQRLLELISKNAVFLSQDPSGNHVVQKVLALENPIFTERICSSLRGHYKRLSLQKWGSHVVEKCLRSTAMECAVEDLLSSSCNQLLQVARDQFGNYVIQSALKVTKKTNNPLHLELLRSLQPHLETLRKGFGRNVFNLIANGVPTDEA